MATILATAAEVGAISWLTYAFRLFQLPVGILSVSIAGSNLVHFSDAWESGKKTEAVGTLQSSYSLSLLSILPAFVLLYTMAEPTVKLLLERGQFSPRDTQMTADALRAYVLGLPFYGLYKIFGPTFFSLDRAKIPVFISVGCILFNIIFCFLLVETHGFVILAFGTSLSMLLNVLAQIIFLRWHLNLKRDFFFNAKVAKYLLAAGLCFVVSSYLSKNFVDLGSPFMPFLGQFILTGFSGLSVYAIVLLVFKEFDLLRRHR